MKQIAKTVLKAVLIIALFTGGSVALSTAGVKTVSEANAAIGYNQVYEYLITNGYTVINAQPYPGGKFDWTALTIKNGRFYVTTIYCNANCIIGNADMPV